MKTLLSSSATAAGNARAADKLSEPFSCPAGRRFGGALALCSKVNGIPVGANDAPHLSRSNCPFRRAMFL
jgi:hypothetical protein